MRLRWLHIYLSMVSFAILFFFAVTGLTLNHQQWFTNQQKTFQYKGQVDRKWLEGNVDKLDIVEYLRSHHGISKAVNEFRVDDGQVSVSFKGPGYEAAVFMTFVSISGLVLIVFLQKRRFSGLMGAALGLALCSVVYLIWVP